jgi:hypothetical protein
MTLSDRAAVSNDGIEIDTGAASGLNIIAARLSPGAISESSSSHLPPSEASKPAKPVVFPLGRSSRATTPLATGSFKFAKTIGIVRVSRWRARVAGRWGRLCYDDVGLQADQLLRECSYPIVVSARPTKVHPHVTAIGPTEVGKRLSERRDATVFVERHEHADAPHSLTLLRPRHNWPRRHAPEPRDERSAFHWITSSAVASSVSGMVRPRALAVLRLMTSSYLTGACTGSSAVFSPLRMRST